MRLTLLPNWRTVAKRAWSMRLTAISVMLSAIEVALPFVAPTAPNGWFALGALCTSIAAAVSRLLEQRSLSGARNA